MKGLRTHLLNMVFYTSFSAKKDRVELKKLHQIHQMIIIKDSRGNNDLVRKVLINLVSFFHVNLKREKFSIDKTKEQLFDNLILKINKLHRKGKTVWLNQIFERLEAYAISSTLKLNDEPVRLKSLQNSIGKELF